MSGRGDGRHILAGQPIARIVSSPFQRALQTADPLAERLGLRVETDRRLVERVLACDLRDDWLEALEISFAEIDFRLTGGESSREAMLRIEGVLAEAIAKRLVTAVVTHGCLLALGLKSFDNSVGYGVWKELTNPDAFRVTTDQSGTSIRRIHVR